MLSEVCILQLLLHPESDDSAQLSQVFGTTILVVTINGENLQVAAYFFFLCFLQIETEKLLAHLVEEEMNKPLVR